jgi:two-component system, NarL family, nitrate/nitrite response regulator NarL
MLVVIGDGQVVLAKLLASVLVKRGWHVGAVPTTPAQFVEAVERLTPDLCLVDARSLGAGPELIESVVERTAGRTKVIALSSDASPACAAASLTAGADGFVTKSGGVDDLLAAVDRVVVGEQVVVESADRARHRSPSNSAAHAMAEYLTTRERQCLALLVDGAGTARIAQVMGVSTLTVRSHIRAVLTKLGVHSRLEAAALEVRHGLLDASDRAVLRTPRSAHVG